MSIAKDEMTIELERKAISNLVMDGVSESTVFRFKLIVSEEVKEDSTQMSYISSQIRDGIVRGINPNWELTRDE